MKKNESMPNLMHNKHLSIENNNVYISLDGKIFIGYTELLENNNKPTIKTYHEDLSL